MYFAIIKSTDMRDIKKSETQLREFKHYRWHIISIVFLLWEQSVKKGMKFVIFVKPGFKCHRERATVDALTNF